MSRIETREMAMEFLFQSFFRNDPIAGQIDVFKENHPELAGDETYFVDMVYGVVNKRGEIDSLFEPFLKKWKLERLPLTDRIILEIAVYEISQIEEIPTSVSINEAVELTKKYSVEDEAAFVNGVLGSVAKTL